MLKSLIETVEHFGITGRAVFFFSVLLFKITHFEFQKQRCHHLDFDRHPTSFRLIRKSNFPHGLHLTHLTHVPDLCLTMYAQMTALWPNTG